MFTFQDNLMPASASPFALSANSVSVEQAVSNRAAVVVTMEKEKPNDELIALRAQLRDERRARAIQKANEKTAQRTADCLRGFHNALLPLLAQPCLTIDREGVVTFWNDAMADWTGLSALSALGRDFKALFAPDALEALEAALQVAAHAAENALATFPAPAPVHGIFSPSETLPGAIFAVLPLCHVPGCLESCLVLFQPLPKSLSLTK
jgi:PAS domain-containing protein